MSNLITSLVKELRCIFRDKKFLSIIFFMPLIIPTFIIVLGFFYQSMEGGNNYSIGVNYELSEVEKEMFKSIDESLEIVNGSSEELEEKYKDGKISAYITKDGEVYSLYVDTSTTTGISVSQLIKAYFEQYNNYLARDYLIKEGVNPDKVFNIIKLEFKEQAKEGTSFFTNYLVSFALIYLVMIASITAMNTSTDIIAGEKERGTFETLLTFPLTSNEIIGGKLLAIVTSCIISTFIGVITAIPAFAFIKAKTEVFANMSLNISVTTLLLAIVALVIISCLVGVLSIFLCGKAKSFKEAQSKASFLTFASLIPLFTNMMDVSNIALYIIPIANGGQILNDLFLNGIEMNNYLLFIISSIVVTFVLLIYVSRQYKDEKALF